MTCRNFVFGSIVLGFALLFSSGADGQSCSWGSFDASRTHKPGAFQFDTGALWTTLRAEIANNGGAVLSGAPVLSAGYLSQCDVFFTSILDDGNGPLSAAEQAALGSWLASGGTLIVAGLQISLGFYDSFTAPFGVTNYVGSVGQGTGSTVGGHPIITGVSSFQHNGHASFSVGGQGAVIGSDSSGSAFLAVLEASTGFTSGGRIFVYGDAEILDDLEVANADHLVLQKNLVAWACDSACSGFFSAYGTGCVGSGGVTPTLSGVGCPTPGGNIQLSLQSAAPNTSSFTLIGVGQGVAAINPTCLLQIAPVLPQVVVIPTGPSGQWTISASIPAGLSTPADVYLQSFISDAGVASGVAGTRPLQLHLQ